MKPLKLLVLLVILPLLFTSCLGVPKRAVTRSFYYWKSAFQLSPAETATLESLKIKRIYLKFFDVTWEGGPVPVAEVSFLTPPPDFLEIVPTVFITNETINNLSTDRIPDLAAKISTKLRRMIKHNQLTAVPEIQIDCDWTTGTRERYFQLLRLLRKGLNSSAKALGHRPVAPGKVRNQTGVPPCDRGMLMFYNMTPVNDPRTKNSILNPELGRAYIATLDTYPFAFRSGLADLLVGSGLSR